MANLRAKHLFDLTFVSDPALSPDGRRAALVQTVIAEAEDAAPRYRSSIFLYDLESGASRQLTFGPLSDTHPRFSPDGRRLAFLSRRSEEGKAQLYALDFAGGEPRALTELPAGVSAFCWHPWSERIAFVSRGDYAPEPDEERLARVLERLVYRSDEGGFLAEEAAQVYLYDLGKNAISRLTKLEHDPKDLVFGPSGRTLYFVAASSEADEEAGTADLYALKLKSGKAKKLLPRPMPLSSPSPSPDGEHLAFFAPQEPDSFASPTGLWLLESRGGEPRLLTNELDAAPSVGGDSRYGLYPNRAAWTASGKALIANVNREGRSGLCRLELASGELTPLTGGDRVVTSFDWRDGRAVFSAESPREPGELFLWQDGEERRLSAVNAKFVERHRLAQASGPVAFDAADGARLSYWTLPPAKPRKDGALVVQVHGGPHTNYGYGFYFEFQLMAARGYTVVYGNPRGSSSFGRDFATAILGRYGTVDADDVLAVTEHAARNHGAQDAPVHLTGGSYGGFMTNWLVGHTERFRSAATQRSISNWLSFYGTSDIGPRFTELEQGGTPWADTEALWRQSPLKYAADISTPLLILHAEADYRCPIEQAEQLYAALKRLGKAPTRFIRFPGENHELSRSGRPDRRVARLEAILDWFKEHA